jgi:hypothetical protein
VLRAVRLRALCAPSAIEPREGAGYVRPGGNAIGFLAYKYSIAAKRLELLKEIAPRVTRAAVLRESATTSGLIIALAAGHRLPAVILRQLFCHRRRSISLTTSAARPATQAGPGSSA